MIFSSLSMTSYWFIVSAVAFCLYLWLRFSPKQKQDAIAFLVVGDMGRSPRMQNHAFCAAECLEGKVPVYLIGSNETPCHSSILQSSAIRIVPLSDLSMYSILNKLRGGLTFPLYACVKIFIQSASLVITLFKIPSLRILLVQNPPSIPTLAIAWGICRIRGVKFFIDWHNYGFTLLRMTLQQTRIPFGSAIVHLSEWIEWKFGRCADCHFCVSKSMQKTLLQRWGIHAEVLYDRPANAIQPIDVIRRHCILFKYFNKEFLPKHSSDIEVDLSNTSKSCFQSHFEEKYLTSETRSHLNCTSEFKITDNSLINSLKINEESICTEMCLTKNGNNSALVTCSILRKRPAVLISATSWTPDENMFLLLDALVLYEALVKKRCEGERALPQLFVIITGKGRTKESWLMSLSEKNLENIFVKTLFAPMEDYYRLLAAADVGVSLHYSSSGDDLPMKIVDMQGVGLPVLAYNFPTAHEQVEEGKNALLFSSAESLCDRFQEILQGFPLNFDSCICNKNENGSKMSNLLYCMRTFTEKNRPISIKEEWTAMAKPFFI
ncbi:chitobiosyldiphosphodolichol beta-mannosyltransferase [Cardiosporidium cionae]|uniref:Beta-1,4-mannosyltransferase n=1 Tax=Cardiosporidium cionae TaxID=476202 RepID=A0ABQ7JCW8_9APIC|nr:chitobiosyldiphosphodolichol beta-mannosyltransferase [Cardiosporidium cionae]|eukprot:KAF8821888.1 chitobiosyldiphosphodolichol beta-mannosyltransferase [Cardiosporidium cionae]